MVKKLASSTHGWDWCKGELSERCVVLAVDTFTLEDWELHCGLLVYMTLVCGTGILTGAYLPATVVKDLELGLLAWFLPM